jgi:hypothetical protein
MRVNKTVPDTVKAVYINGKKGKNPNKKIGDVAGSVENIPVSAIRNTLIEWMGNDYQKKNNDALKKIMKSDYIQKVVFELPDTITQILLKTGVNDFYERIKHLQADFERTTNNELYERAAITTIFAHLSDYFGVDDFFEEHCYIMLSYLHKFCRIAPDEAIVLTYDEIIKKNILSKKNNETSNINAVFNVLQKKIKADIFATMPKLVLVLKFLYSYFANGTLQTNYNFGAMVNCLQIVIDGKNPYDRYINEYYRYQKVDRSNTDFSIFRTQCKADIYVIPGELNYQYGEDEKSPFKSTERPGCGNIGNSMISTLVGNPSNRAFSPPQIDFEPKLTQSKTLKEQMYDYIMAHMATTTCLTQRQNYNIIKTHLADLKLSEINPVRAASIMSTDIFHFMPVDELVFQPNEGALTFVLVVNGTIKYFGILWAAPFIMLLRDDYVYIIGERQLTCYRLRAGEQKTYQYIQYYAIVFIDDESIVVQNMAAFDYSLQLPERGEYRDITRKAIAVITDVAPQHRRKILTKLSNFEGGAFNIDPGPIF